MNQKKIIIFGLGHAAEVAAHCLSQWAPNQLLCFTIDREFISQKNFLGKEVVPFDIILRDYPPKNYSIFVATGYSDLNKLRTSIVNRLIEQEYYLPSIFNPCRNFVSNSIGCNCLILDGANIQPFAKVGDNNFIWSGTDICHHVSIGNNCWLTSGVTIGGSAKIGDNCFLGAGATIANDVAIGNNCFIGAGALVTNSINDCSVVIKKGTETHKLNSSQFLKLINNRF